MLRFVYLSMLLVLPMMAWSTTSAAAEGDKAVDEEALAVDEECVTPAAGPDRTSCGLSALQRRGLKKQGGAAAAAHRRVTSGGTPVTAVPAAAATAAPVRVANVGTSITYGFHASKSMSYPEQLQRLLGTRYLVQNDGHNGAALMRHARTCEEATHNASMCFFNFPEYSRALEFKPDIVVSNFGTNDAKNCNWNQALFEAAYSELIGAFQALASKPVVYLIIPPPLYKDGRYGGLNQTIINTILPKVIAGIAQKSGLAPPIDVFSAFKAHCPDLDSQDCDWISDADGTGKPDFHDDGAHPNDKGYGEIAKLVQDRLLHIDDSTS